MRMPKIVDMKMRRGRPERFIVKLEDEQEVIMAPETVLKFGIAPRLEFTDKQFLEILDEDSLRQAKDQAMRYLGIRPHSRLELVRKMRSKGFRYTIINQALDELEKIDLLNDALFARAYIQNELRLRPVSRALLSKKLAERGVDRELIDRLIAELYTDEKEWEVVQYLADKFVRTHSRWTGQKLREKLVRYLQSKGFSWEHIRQVIDVTDDE